MAFMYDDHAPPGNGVGAPQDIQLQGAFGRDAQDHQGASGHESWCEQLPDPIVFLVVRRQAVVCVVPDTASPK